MTRDTEMLLAARTLTICVRKGRGANQQPIPGATIHIEVSVASQLEPLQYTATTNADGQARIEDVAAGKLRVWGERTDGDPLDIVQVNDLQIPPGALAWLRETDPHEITTSLELLALPPPIMLNFRLPDDDEAGPGYRHRRTAEAAETETWYRLNDDEIEYLRENGNNATILVHGYNVALGEPPTSRQVTTDTVTAHSLQSRDGPDDPRSEATTGDPSVYGQLHGANALEDPVPAKGFVEIHHLERTNGPAYAYNDPERLKRPTPGN